MDRIKLFAFLLIMVGAGAVLLATHYASGPFFVSRPGAGPMSPGFQMVAMLCLGLPLAGVPGILGLVLWLGPVERREAKRAQEVLSLSLLEDSLQRCYDRILTSCLERNSELSMLLTQLQGEVDRFDETCRFRWRRFLGNSGAPGTPLPAAKGGRIEDFSEVSIRTLAFVLMGFSLLAFLWGVQAFFMNLRTEVAKVYGLQPSIGFAWFGAGGCFLPALVGGASGVALLWMLRRQRRSQATKDEAREDARAILLDRSMHRLQRLAAYLEPESPDGTMVSRLARASAIDAFAELDGARKGRLLLYLHTCRLTPEVDLRTADLRSALLAGADLTAARLSGIDFSGSSLIGAHLDRAEVQGCCFQGADLRNATAEGADLRQSSFRGAWLHHCRLRAADLRCTDLRGANLWNADLAEANLEDSFVSPDQLRSVASLADARWS